MKVLVAYASKHGATEGIARFIAERLRERGKESDARPVEEVVDLDGVGAVVLGSAVYAGSWMKSAMELVHRSGDELGALPVWLFSSGPLGTDIEDAEQQPKQLDELKEALHPKDHRVFFGALNRDELGFAERMIVKAVKAPDGDYRDWEAIGAWTDGISGDLDG